MSSRSPDRRDNSDSSDTDASTDPVARNLLIVIAMFPFVFLAVFGVIMSIAIKSWIPFFAMGTMGAVFGAGLVLARRRRPGKTKRPDRSWSDVLVAPYREFAKHVDGTLVAAEPTYGGLVPGCPEYVNFEIDGNPASLRFERDEREDSSDHHLRLEMDLPKPTSLRCHIYDQDILSRIAGKDIKLGWAHFDKQFAVTSDSGSVLVSRYVTREVQEGLLKLKEWLKERRRRNQVEFFVSRQQVMIRIDVMLYDDEDIIAFYLLGKNLYEEMRISLDSQLLGE